MMPLKPGERITVRFDEVQRYDPMKDQEVVQFQAITNIGTYYAETEFGGPRSLRRDRERFRERAVEAMSAGVMPGAVSLVDH